MASIIKSSVLPKAEATTFNIFRGDEVKAFIKKQRSKYSEFQANPNAYKSHLKYYTRNPREDDKPIICGSQEEMLDVMHKSVMDASGINFTLGMLSEDGVHQVWKRYNQPCQGGEMRKYGVTHDDCTRPDDPRPGDLTMPFPDGKPLAVGIKPSYSSFSEQLRHYAYQDESPYARAFGSAKNVELVGSAAKPVGFIYTDADQVEVTTIVHMSRQVWTGSDFALSTEQKLKLTPSEYFLLKMMASGGNTIYHKDGYGDSEDNTNWIDLKSFMKGGVEASKNLSKGTLGGRFDYHRPAMMRIFKKSVGNNYDVMNIAKKIVEMNKGCSIPVGSVKVGVLREAIEWGLDQYSKKVA